MSVLGERLRLYREYLELSQAEAAAYYKIPQSTWAYYESRAKSLPHAFQMLLRAKTPPNNKLGINLNWLASGDPPMAREWTKPGKKSWVPESFTDFMAATLRAVPTPETHEESDSIRLNIDPQGDIDEFKVPEHSFSSRLHSYLLEKGWDANDLINASGIDEETVLNLLNDEIRNPNPDIVKILSIKTDANPEYLLTGKGRITKSRPIDMVERMESMLHVSKNQMIESSIKVKHALSVLESFAEMVPILDLSKKDVAMETMKALGDSTRLLKSSIEDRQRTLGYIELVWTFMPLLKSWISEGETAKRNQNPTGAIYQIEAVEEAYKLLHEAVRAAGADIMALDPNKVAGVLRITVRELARTGNTEEVRRQLIREAELILGLVKGSS